MSADAAEAEIQTAQTVVAIVTGVVVIVGVLVLVAVFGALRERKLREDVAKQAQRVELLKKEMDGKARKGANFQTLEDLMKPYKKHLLQSAFDLQSRLNGQLTSTFLYEFKTRGARDRAYAIDSTTYFFAEFFGWLEVIRRQVVFITGSEYAESLNSLLDSIRFQLTGETPIQGCRKGCAKNDDTYDINSHILQLYIVDIRSIGNAMLHMVDNLWRPITVDTFLQRMNSDDPQHKAFRLIIDPLHRSLTALSELDPKTAPTRRIAIFQVLLCKLIDILDNAVPWDCGPKFDSNQEPRYIQRDMRMTPGVRFLSNLQKAHLHSMPFFDDDPNLSFQGFREDMKNQPQEFRDEKLWPGACPPQEPRPRAADYVTPDQYLNLGARVVGWPGGLRRRARRGDPGAKASTAGGTSTAAQPPVAQPSPSQQRRTARLSIDMPARARQSVDMSARGRQSVDMSGRGYEPPGTPSTSGRGHVHGHDPPGALEAGGGAYNRVHLSSRFGGTGSMAARSSPTVDAGNAQQQAHGSVHHAHGAPSNLGRVSTVNRSPPSLPGTVHSDADGGRAAAAAAAAQRATPFGGAAAGEPLSPPSGGGGSRGRGAVNESQEVQVLTRAELPLSPGNSTSGHLAAGPARHSPPQQLQIAAREHAPVVTG